MALWRERVRDDVQATLIDWWEAMEDNHEITQDDLIKLACKIAESIPPPDDE